MLPGTYLADNQGLRDLKTGYIGQETNAARFQVVLDTGPYTPTALDTVETSAISSRPRAAAWWRAQLPSWPTCATPPTGT